MPEGRARVAASILNSNLANLAHEVRKAVRSGADRIHIDVMDAHFVPNLTFGAGTIRALRPVTRSPFDAHLMIDEPGRWIDDYIEAGCDSITFHVEVDEPKEPVLRKIRAAGRAAGLAVKPATPLSALEPYRELLDIVMVMTVEPGFGGQAFMKDVAMAKILRARDLLAHKPWGGEIHVDGGVSRETADIVGGQGADILVAGTALFAKGRDAGREVRLIKALADEAYSYERNDGRPAEPRERMSYFGALPRKFALALLDRIEAHGVPGIMLRANGQMNPDGVRDFDILLPTESMAWAEATYGPERDRLAVEAEAWRADLRARGIDRSQPGPDGTYPLPYGEPTPTENLARLTEARRRRRRRAATGGSPAS